MGQDTFGFECTAFYGTAGSSASSVLSCLRDVTVTLGATEAETSTRATGGWKTFATGLKDLSIDLALKKDASDAGYAALETAFTASTALALKFLDNTSGDGPDADFVVTKFDRAEPLDGIVEVSCTVRPTYITRAPAWANGAASV